MNDARHTPRCIWVASAMCPTPRVGLGVLTAANFLSSGDAAAGDFLSSFLLPLLSRSDCSLLVVEQYCVKRIDRPIVQRRWVSFVDLYHLAVYVEDQGSRHKVEKYS